MARFAHRQHAPHGPTPSASLRSGRWGAFLAFGVACAGGPTEGDPPTPPSSDLPGELPAHVDTDANPSTDPVDPAPVDSPLEGPNAPTDTAPTSEPDPCAGCDDGDACNGAEACDVDGACIPGAPVVCAADATCITQQDAPICVPWCGIPTAPNVRILGGGDALTFAASHPVETALLDTTAPTASAVWTSDAVVVPPNTTGTWRVLARAIDPACVNQSTFSLTYTWSEQFPGPAGSPTGQAWAWDDSRFTAWATGVWEQNVGTDVASVWLDASRALGPASTTTTDILALGEGGSVTLQFDVGIADGPGDDFAIFENGFSDDFLELAEVAVSSDGQTYAAFDTASHVPDPIGAFGTLDPTALHGFAGTLRVGFGVGFDLERLSFHPAVVAGWVQLDAISHVRVLDVPGDGRRTDAWGRPVYDPWPTVGSAGFDLDAIGVLNRTPP